MATLRSDQAATLVVFARAGHDSAPAAMRVLRQALILDADGYEAPVFSADGRRFAIRGNAYENSLAVFEFPSLQLVLATTLGMPSPGYPYPQGWLEQMRAWSRHNIAFGAQPSVLWAGTPTGNLVEVDLDNQHAARHDVLAGSPVTALSAALAGNLVAATGEGDLVLMSVLTGSAKTHAADARTSRALVTTFLDATSEVPGYGDQPAHTRSKIRIRPAVSSTANTMNPKSPTSATRRRGTPVGALNTGSYGSSQILASSVTSMSNACSGRPCICRSASDSRCGR